MDKIAVKEIEDIKIWEGFLAKHLEANFLQSWYWGEFHKRLGKSIYRSGFYSKNRLLGVMLAVKEDAKRGKYLTVPGGPIIDWENRNLVKKFVEEVERIAKIERCVFVRVRPQLENNNFSKNIFSKYDFIDAPMHLHAELTSKLDITKSEEELLAGMRKTTRYEIRKGESLGIQVTASKDAKEIEKFYELQVLTSKRQGFVPFAYGFLYEQFKVFASAGKALLYSARLKNKLLAQAFVIFYGNEAVYHYGASTEDGRKYPGSYLLQWEAIKEAKRRGMTIYNFWGVAPIEETNHRFYGISIFKRGFGGVDFAYLHAQDLVINRTRYLINFAVENIRKMARRV